MCDYSLEAYKTRPAREGETITTQRFPSGSLGFVAPENNTVAVCLACDTQLRLANLPASIQKACGTGETAIATFTQLDTTAYRDAVKFESGKSVTLQQLGIGVSAMILDGLTQPTNMGEPPATEQAPSNDRALTRNIRETVSNLLDT